MKLILSLLLTTMLFMCVAPSASAQTSKGKHNPGKRKLVRDPITLEKLIFGNLKLTPSQKQRADGLVDTLSREVHEANGLGLAPRDPKTQAKKIVAIKAEYQKGLKQVLTPAQLKRYVAIHQQIATALQRRRQPGMHF